MAQFDLIIIFPVVWGLFLTLILNYFILINILLPNFSGLLKFRKKILNLSKLKVLKFGEIAVY
jgi:hypothetical protein|uniref:ATPase subunit 8 n=1 Tax=Entomoneis sp. TaxID=186043 RepID=A0A3G1PWC2_9STRA|nr:ATPase subunit 8 [Entomoneis sp.]